MSHKTLAKIAVVMLIVFGGTVLIYPMLFNPDDKNKTTLVTPVNNGGVMPPASH